MTVRHPKPPRRPPTAWDMLHAIARMIGAAQPDGMRLAVPGRIENIWQHDSEPVSVVLPAHDHVHHVRRWADALEDLGQVTLVGVGQAHLVPGVGTHMMVADTHIEVTGRIPRTSLRLTVRASVTQLPVPFVGSTPAMAGWTRRIAPDWLRRLDDARPLRNPLGRAR